MVNYARGYYYLRKLLKRVYWPKERLRRYQNERLREVLKYAYENVPFYHKKFDEVGVKPSDVRTTEDLKKVPITEKEEIKKNLGQAISKEYKASGLKMLRTSGSTGEPLYFYISGKEDEYRKARHLRANIICGQHLRDRYVTVTHPIYFSQTTRLQRFLGFYAPIPISVFDDVDMQISVLERLKPDILDGYASSLLLLAKRIDEKGIENTKPRFVISGADLIDMYSRKYVEEVFKAPFYDQYACVELERLAWQCEERDGYHIDADSIIMEFVDENSEEVVAGETGEVVCTSLFNHAMPFIRYAVGDIGKISEKTMCSCGRTFPLMRILEGRKADIISLPDGRFMSSFAFIAAMYQLSFYGNVDQFRVLQEKEDVFRFLIKMKGNRLNRKSAEEELTVLFCRVLSIARDEVSFEVDFVDDIPLDESGKFRVVVSKSHLASEIG